MIRPSARKIQKSLPAVFDLFVFREHKTHHECIIVISDTRKYSFTNHLSNSVNQLKYMIDIYYYHMSCTYTWCSTLQSPTKEFVLL